MAYVKINKEELESIKSDANSKISRALKSLNGINTIASSTPRVDPENMIKRDEYTYEVIQDNSWKARAYNKALNDLVNSSSSYSGTFDTEGSAFITSIDGVLKAVETYESATVEEMSSNLETSETGDYGEMYFYSTDPAGSPEGNSGGCGSGGGGCGSSGGGCGSGGFSDVGSTDDDQPTTPEDTSGDGSTDDPTTPTPSDSTEDDEEPTPPDDTSSGDGSGDDGEPHDPEDTGDDPHKPGDDDSEDEDPTKPEEPSGDTGDKTDGDGTDEEPEDGEDQKPPEDPTAADLIQGTPFGFDDIVTDPDKTGAEVQETAALGMGGAAALMLGLTGLSTDGGSISELATGLDQYRTLPEAGLDVFEHPDYTGEGGTGNGNGLDLMSSRAGGNGENGDGEDGDGTDGFSVRAAEDLDSDEGDGSEGGGFGKGFGALMGAGALGGIAAGLAMQDGSSYGDGEFGDGAYGAGGLGDGAFGDGALGDGSDGDGNSGGLRRWLFGAPLDEDDEEKRRRSILETIAMILLGFSLTSTLGTFLLANSGAISNYWFLVALILFAASYLFVNILRDNKNKKRKELAATQGLNLMAGRKSFFGVNNNGMMQNNQNGMVNAAVRENEEDGEADWILYGMIMLSSSAFILKTYDIISWLIFIILLILFILIILAYVILKKKLGEDDEQGS